MKKATILGAIVAVSLLGSTAAMADSWQSRDYRWHKKQERIHDKWEREQYKQFKRERAEDRRAYNRWVRGHALPSEYRYNRYIVSDWDRYHLRRPPVGYNWYRADNNYVLVRRDNNLIEDIIDALD
ncbi:MAG: hypothetical protein K0R10_2950 [Alphaproteobacteria bacterium]|jgi:Ni/Co efflux regulator RcnB|nr:hypothetical protein [Alphaproteobacteria bacterium]